MKLLGEVGLGSVKAGDEAKQMVAWARKYGIQSTIHTGGPSIPGSGLIDKDVVLEADADVIGHINGGHTALPLEQIRCLCEQCGRAIEIVHNGNELAGALRAAHARSSSSQLDRVILGTDSPAGSGVQPLGILRMIAMLSSLGDVPAEQRLLLRHRQHRAPAQARLRPDRSRPRAPISSSWTGPSTPPARTLLESVGMGDLPGVGMIIIDGIVRAQRRRNTPPATKVPEVVV